MSTTIVEVIQNENPRRPYTDDWLAQHMGLRREQIVELRHRAGIPNSRVRVKKMLKKDILRILDQESSLSDRALTECLNEEGYEVSRYLVREVRNTLIEENQLPKISTIEKKEQLKQKESDAFSRMIGYSGGLQAQIHQAKAAMAYPPNGLHAMIIGPSGTGKTFLAENMYQYAIENGFLPKGAPFVSFNCADYADNPQLLNSQLFGYVKGAFSGANDTRDGLVAKANGGILFLDEVHRLSGEGQEMLFYLLDKGAYRRLGDSGTAKQVNVRLIAATTSAPESTLLLTFRRRIPIVISMPALSDRPIPERFEILRHIFEMEQKKLNQKLIVEPEAVSILLQYECAGNIGQLQSDIQVCCAHAFLECVSKKYPVLRITWEHVSHLAKKPLQPCGIETSNMYHCQLVFPPEGKVPQIFSAAESAWKKLRHALDDMGLSDPETLERLCQQPTQWETLLPQEQTSGNCNSERLPHILVAVHQELEKLQDRLNSVDESFEKALALHLNDILNCSARDRKSEVERTLQLQDHFPSEFAVASAFSDGISEQLNCILSEGDRSFLSLYFYAFAAVKKSSRVRIIIMTHGQTGAAMAEVVNHILRDNNTIGFSTGWNESTEQVLERAIQVVQQADEGQGCLLLTDMGTPTSLAPEIALRTGVKVQCVARVDTLMALDAARRVLLERECSLENLARTLEVGRLHAGFSNFKVRTGKPPAILTVCITGDGTARRVQGFLKSTLVDYGNIAIVEVGLLNRDALITRVEELRQKFDIIATVGSMNPELTGIPFLSIPYVLSGYGALALNKLLEDYMHQNLKLGNLLEPQLIFYDTEFKDKNDALDKMYERLLERGCVRTEFLLSVYKRENLGSTCLACGIAIPHGEPEFVTKPAICVAKLREPLEWSADSVADFVFLFALDENSQEYIQTFYEIIKDEKSVDILKNAKSVEEIYNILA